MDQIVRRLSHSETSFTGVKKVMIYKSMSCFRRDKIDDYNDKNEMTNLIKLSEM